MNCYKLIPCSSSENKTEHRAHISSNVHQVEWPKYPETRLSIEHISALMFIKLNGPNIRTWKPEYYVRIWLRRHRTADDTRTRRGKRKHQPGKEEEDAFADYL
ncbi:hypothetical protein QE152_g39792 [Popillia japonica]|uniref:Uncharacterized protein n=1 Tax=Popillia japonica TaxID=7064 RepID=A0AAW1HTD2_POPJA